MIYYNLTSCFTTVQIRKDDGLPQVICQTCQDDLNIVTNFKEKLERSDAQLRLLLGKLREEEASDMAIEVKAELDLETNFDEASPEHEEDQSCQNCGLSFSTQEEVDHHQRVHQCYVELTCSVCGISTSTRKALKRHYNSGIHLKKVGLSPGDRQTPSKAHFKSQRKKSNNCSACGKTFANSSGLQKHLPVHNTSREFIQSDQVSAHPKFECDLCRKSYALKSVLREHMRVHSKEPYAICPFCGRNFTCVSNMKQHMLRHTNTKNFECRHCGKKFVSKGELQGHERVHTKSKPYACNTCGASFTMSYSLKKHQRTHSGERPYACEFCDKKFKILETMKIHRRIHTGEKPYSCSFCGRTFTQKNDMVKHERIHTGQRLYGCKVCGKRFIQASTLATHIKGVHKGQSEPFTTQAPETTIGAFSQIDVYHSTLPVSQ